MRRLQVIGGLAGVALAAAASPAGAALAGPTTVTFNSIGAAIFGRANVVPVGTGACPSTPGACYTENLGTPQAVVFGTAEDPTPFVGASAHVHGANYDAGNPLNKGMGYASDSAGIYMRMRDSTAFSLNSMTFHAPIGLNNPNSGSSDYWEILGFDFATNPTVTTDGSVPVATQTVANGFDGTLTLNSGFQNIKSFWIHYHGYPTTPTDPDLVLDVDGNPIADGPLTAKTFEMAIDNVVLSTPATTPVPVPAAVWLFGSALAGLLSFGRKNKVG